MYYENQIFRANQTAELWLLFVELVVVVPVEMPTLALPASYC